LRRCDVLIEPDCLRRCSLNASFYVYGPSHINVEQTQYLDHDQAGSTQFISSETGITEAAYSYTPYGAVEEHTGTATTPFGYDAQYTNSDTGLIYLRAREYDPATGQFLSVDPLVAATRAPYTYAGDNPLNNEDPTGLAWQGCVGGTVSLGFFSFGGEVCYVSTPGGSGIAATGSVTAGPGFGANVHAGGGASNACRPSEYGGPFAQAGGSAEGIVGGYGNAFTNAPVPGHGRTVVGATGGATAGFGVEGGAGGSETVVVPFGGESSGGSCSC
jgi:RHS repeat-associated protein